MEGTGSEGAPRGEGEELFTLLLPETPSELGGREELVFVAVEPQPLDQVLSEPPGGSHPLRAVHTVGSTCRAKWITIT